LQEIEQEAAQKLEDSMKQLMDINMRFDQKDIELQETSNKNIRLEGDIIRLNTYLKSAEYQVNEYKHALEPLQREN
jgi:chromosome segregation ATPase